MRELLRCERVQYLGVFTVCQRLDSELNEVFGNRSLWTLNRYYSANYARRVSSVQIRSKGATKVHLLSEAWWKVQLWLLADRYQKQKDLHTQ